jgi:hypothetical protein
MKTKDNILDSFDVVERIISSDANIARFHILDVPVPPLLQERVHPVTIDSSTIQEATELKSRYGLQFWDAYFVAIKDNPDTIEKVFSAALLHDNATSRLRQIKAEDAVSLREAEAEVKPGNMLALSSLVKLRNGEMRHIPMLDFHFAASTRNEALAVSALKALTGKNRGFLVQSGKSYHYYGFELLSQAELPKFLARAILLGHIFDRRWISHQIIEGACALRIGSGHGYASLPFVVAQLP